MVVSSAYKTTSEFVQHLGLSLIYIRKKVRPNIDPCGTPQLTSMAFDVLHQWRLFEKTY